MIIVSGTSGKSMAKDRSKCYLASKTAQKSLYTASKTRVWTGVDILTVFFFHWDHADDSAGALNI
jgi:hypothetical protein